MNDQLKFWLVAILAPILAIAFQVFLSRFIQHPYFVLYFSAVLLSTAYGGKKSGMLSLIILSSSNLLPIFFGLEGQTILYNNVLSVSIFSLEAAIMIFILDHFKETDQVNIQKQKLSDLQTKLKDLEKKYNTAQEEIKVRDEFLSIASHELKTPLTAMVLQLQTALHNIKNVSLANFSVQNLLKMLEKAENQTNRLSRIINDLLNASRVSSRHLNLEKEKFDITQSVVQVAENFNEEANEKGDLIEVKTNGEIHGHWDRIRIEQAVTNLISNAIKYGENKPIEIEVKESSKTAQVVVKDKGIGIAEEDLGKIFTLFERAHENKRIEGSGVGLYITDRIIKAHGGRIEVKSRLGKGSEFRIHLPIQE